MTSKPKPKSKAEPTSAPLIVPAEPEAAPEVVTNAPPRVARHVQPLGPRVLVRVVKNPDRSETGLFLPQGVKDSHAAALLGEVVEVARTKARGDTTEELPDLDDDDDDRHRDRNRSLGENVSGVPLGANVLFEKERGIAVPWDESLRILEVRHVLAIVDIIGQDEIQ